MKKYRQVLFDFDYTLADSSRAIVECISYSLKKMGLDVPETDKIRRTIGLTLSDAYSTLSSDFSRTNANTFGMYFREKADLVMTDGTRIYDGTEEVLRSLMEMKIKIGIVSTKFRFRIEEILEREGLKYCFDTIVGGEDVKSHKPDPEGLLKAVSILKGKRSNTIYVGDSIVDAQAAKNADVDFIAVLTGVTPRHEFLQFDTYALLKDLSELGDAISSVT